MAHQLPSPAEATVAIAVAIAVYVALVAIARLVRRGWAVRFGVTFHLFAAAVGLLAGVGATTWHSPAADAVRRHLTAIALLLAAFPATALLNRLLWRRSAGQTATRGDTPRVLADATGLVVVLVAALFVLDSVYGVRVPGLLAGSGVVAIILGLALQDLLGNLFAGIALYLQNSFAPGDWLLVDGVHARVVELSWRSTRLVTTDDVLIDVPNNTIVKHTITNFERPSPRHAVRLTLGLHYDVPPARAQDVLRRAAATVAGVAAQPAPVVYVKEFADSAVVYEVKVWIDDHARLGRVSSDLRSHCWYAVRRAGLEIPFPTITVRRPAADAEPDRARHAAARALREHAIFGFIAEDQIAALVDESPVVLFAPDEHVVEQDAPGESMFLLVQGHVEVRIQRDGRSTAVAQLAAGACFGEMSVLTGQPRTATVVALDEVEAVEITKAAMADLVAARPEVVARLSELLVERQTANASLVQDAAAAEQNGASSTGMLRRLRAFFQLGV